MKTIFITLFKIIVLYSKCYKTDGIFKLKGFKLNFEKLYCILNP